jgi:hypothetical protein
MRTLFALTIATIGNLTPIFASQSFTFYSPARGHNYTVYTEQLGTALTFPGHGLIESSVILAAPETGGVYVLLLNTNLVAHQDPHHGEAIFFSWSNSVTGPYSTPTPVLTNTGVSNICDMSNARPVWDGSLWHVYVQAEPGDYTQPCSYGTVPGVIYEGGWSFANAIVVGRVFWHEYAHPNCFWDKIRYRGTISMVEYAQP